MKTFPAKNIFQMMSFAFAFLMLFPAPAPAATATKVAVVLPGNAAPPMKIAADELTAHLRILYPQTTFETGTPSTGAAACVIRLETDATLSVPDSYAVKVLNDREAVIAGSNPRAVLHAVSALLEKLGFGFYLSYSTQPAPMPDSAPFSFAGWDLQDAPAPGAATRAVLDWHNFLTGCSTWNLDDWQRWITQISRMRFNTVMVHVYGQTPIFSFTYNGQTKPLAYMTNTRTGRDNGTEHVLDVRRIIGADDLFDGPVFGSAAARVPDPPGTINFSNAGGYDAPDAQRADAAIAMMQQVFRFAAARGMGVSFGLSIDTRADNPQNIIATLPAAARFTAADGGIQIANPDTPEGHAYYRAIMERLFALYPEITQVSLWIRGFSKGNSVNSLRGIKPAEFPAAWKKEYNKLIEQNPSMRNNPESPSMFATGKIIRAYRKALDELGHPAVTLALGCWRFDYMPAADIFLPRDVILVPLDYNNEFPSTLIQYRTLRDIGRHRPVVPVIWAQHDDFQYAGRSYTPVAGLGSLLNWNNSAGFAIIHWMTRPHDLYFKNNANQVWDSTFNEPLETTARDMAGRNFAGAPDFVQQLAACYLLDWIQDAPAFGEETSDTFLKHEVDLKNAQPGSDRRLDLLALIAPLASTPEQLDWVAYYEYWERYALAVFQAQTALQESRAAQQAGDLPAARAAIARADPKAAIEYFSRAIRHGQTTRGELGLLVSLNLRWLPYFKAQRVALGMEPLQIKFAPTHHDPDNISRAPGVYTFDFDDNHDPIEVAGTKELGTEVTAGGIEINQHPVTLALGSLTQTDLPDGPCILQLDLPPGVTVQVKTENVAAAQTATSDTEIKTTASKGTVRLTLLPAPGSAPVRISGATLKKLPE